MRHSSNRLRPLLPWTPERVLIRVAVVAAIRPTTITIRPPPPPLIRIQWAAQTVAAEEVVGVTVAIHRTRRAFRKRTPTSSTRMSSSSQGMRLIFYI